MQVSYGEGVAIRTGPESCATAREGRGEALTGDSIGQPLSRERILIPDADVVHWTEGNTVPRAMRARCRSGVVADPGMCRRSLNGNREISGSDRRGRALARRGGPRRKGEEP